MSAYNYKDFSAGHYDLDNLLGPEAGQRAPDGNVFDLAGRHRRLLDFKGSFLVLEFGSGTCPLFQSRRRGMSALPARHPDVDFAVLYVREAHPGENISAHQSMEDKLARARSLRGNDREHREILVDDLEGTVHASYGSYPNPVFIINRNGCIVYRSAWNNPTATGAALKRLKEGLPVRSEAYFFPPRPPAAFPTLRGGGLKAIGNFLRSLPVLIWKNAIKRNLRHFAGKWMKAVPDARC